MKRYVGAVAMVGLLAGSYTFARAAEPTRPSGPAQLTLPPNSVPPVEPTPEPVVECDLLASPDYVAGIDAQGRDVVPADVPSSQPVEIGTDVFVETRSRAPRLRGTGVVVSIPGLGAPACVSVDEKQRK